MRLVDTPDWHAEFRREFDDHFEDQIVNEICEDAIRGAPIATGRLAYHIVWYRTGPDDWRVHSRMPYTTAVEYNTAAHRIRRVRARALHWIDGHGHHFRREVWHPGTTEQPFMRPALFKERRL